MKKNRQQQKRGFVILFAVLMSGVIALMTYSIFSVTQKSLILSSLATESQLAFYAADAGVECALYLDQKIRAFDTPPIMLEYGCNGLDLSDEIVGPFVSPGSTVYTFNLPTSYATVSDRGQCALVAVRKVTETTPQYTLIESRGYNSCFYDDGDVGNTKPFWADPSLVERRLEVRYIGI